MAKIHALCADHLGKVPSPVYTAVNGDPDRGKPIPVKCDYCENQVTEFRLDEG